jgi:aminoglycoside phosphotransferase (APT) family kinase protein
VDAAPEPGPGWQQNIVQSVLHGFDSYCVISSLENYSRRTADLLERLQGLVTEWDGLPFRSGDIVHFDFHHNNILFNDADLTGVVDWDGVSAGDRAFDLVTLLFYLHDNQPASDVLWRELQMRSTREAVGSYLAHMIVRQLDWLIRFYDEEVVEVFTGISEAHLAELQRRFVATR